MKKKFPFIIIHHISPILTIVNSPLYYFRINSTNSFYFFLFFKSYVSFKECKYNNQFNPLTEKSENCPGLKVWHSFIFSRIFKGAFLLFLCAFLWQDKFFILCEIRKIFTISSISSLSSVSEVVPAIFISRFHHKLTIVNYTLYYFRTN